MSSTLFSLQVKSTLKEWSDQEWNRCLGSKGCPFLRYEFLLALEESECVGEESGWIPFYFGLFMNSRQVGAVAAYQKWNSQGEFIFDWSWAEAAQRVGLPYYPKLTVASPFSPVGGPRFLIDDSLSQDSQKDVFITLVNALRQWGVDFPITGLHFLFISNKEAEQLEKQDFLIRHSLQYHWHNQGYTDFNDFLSCFKSKTRNQIRRERRSVYDQGVSIKAYIGDEIQEEHLPLIYSFYTKTVDQFFWGQRYLNYTFFKKVYQTMRQFMCLILAYQKDEVIGGTFNLVSDGVLYGRYWGGLDDIETGRPRVPFLHFEVCSYFAIDLCIQKGWTRFEPGAGGREHKCKRGFFPTRCYSAHEVYLPGFQNALVDFLDHEQSMVRLEVEETSKRIFRNKNP